MKILNYNEFDLIPQLRPTVEELLSQNLSELGQTMATRIYEQTSIHCNVNLKNSEQLSLFDPLMPAFFGVRRFVYTFAFVSEEDQLVFQLRYLR